MSFMMQLIGVVSVCGFVAVAHFEHSLIVGLVVYDKLD